jgi:hypothetical protein
MARGDASIECHLTLVAEQSGLSAITPFADIERPPYSPTMSYRQKSGRNWGVATACFIAVPLALAWTAISILGGSLVCADEAAHCAGVVWPLVLGIAAIAAAATALGCVINLIIGRIAQDR